MKPSHIRPAPPQTRPPQSDREAPPSQLDLFADRGRVTPCHSPKPLGSLAAVSAEYSRRLRVRVADAHRRGAARIGPGGGTVECRGSLFAAPLSLSGDGGSGARRTRATSVNGSHRGDHGDLGRRCDRSSRPVRASQSAACRRGARCPARYREPTGGDGREQSGIRHRELDAHRRLTHAGAEHRHAGGRTAGWTASVAGPCMRAQRSWPACMEQDKITAHPSTAFFDGMPGVDLRGSRYFVSLWPVLYGEL